MATSTPAPTDLVGFLDYYLVGRSPIQLPDNAKEWIVRYGPWITVVLLVLMLPALLLALGVGAALVPIGGVGYATGFTYLAIFTLAQMGLMIAALPGLFARTAAGWRLMFYSTLVGIGGSAFQGSIVSGLIGALIGLFILFQIRPLYKQ